MPKGYNKTPKTAEWKAWHKAKAIKGANRGDDWWTPARIAKVKKQTKKENLDKFPKADEGQERWDAKTKREHRIRDKKRRGVYNKNWRERHYKREYDISEEDFQRMLEEQKGVCAICETNNDMREGKQIRLAVDHCHDTGNVRGLLCRDCNRAIGQLKHDPILLERAREYLCEQR